MVNGVLYGVVMLHSLMRNETTSIMLAISCILMHFIRIPV